MGKSLHVRLLWASNDRESCRHPERDFVLCVTHLIRVAQPLRRNHDVAAWQDMREPVLRERYDAALGDRRQFRKHVGGQGRVAHVTGHQPKFNVRDTGQRRTSVQEVARLAGNPTPNEYQAFPGTMISHPIEDSQVHVVRDPRDSGVVTLRALRDVSRVGNHPVRDGRHRNGVPLQIW